MNFYCINKNFTAEIQRKNVYRLRQIIQNLWKFDKLSSEQLLAFYCENLYKIDKVLFSLILKILWICLSRRTSTEWKMNRACHVYNETLSSKFLSFLATKKARLIDFLQSSRCRLVAVIFVENSLSPKFFSRHYIYLFNFLLVQLDVIIWLSNFRECEAACENLNQTCAVSAFIVITHVVKKALRGNVKNANDFYTHYSVSSTDHAESQ